MPQTVWNIETAVWDKIDATSAITAIVGKGNSSRAFPEVRFDGAVRPCIVYELASSRPFQTLSGSPTLVFSTIAIHCMGDTKIQAVNLARKVQDAFQEWSGTWYDGATLKLTVSGGRTSTITTDYLAPTDGATYGLFVSTVEVTCFHTN
jgi:hypothetical protein